ncbi:S41 family peptidase [Brevundimonas sp.]|uniref:S41 family peptidase n=1 Tax=Brevundimonas sp. TaxID=1871086 RepID=UPI0039E634A7
MDAPRDWSAALETDARAFHAAIADGHPGMHDPLNPLFAEQVDAALAEALERASLTRDAGGWWWGLRALVARFDDGHVQVGMTDQTWAAPTRWPGFLTLYRDGFHVVASRDGADPLAPPVGARLADCDGVAADDLAQRRVGVFRGRWFLAAQREQWSHWLFLDASNPWIERPATCRFHIEGRVRTFDLTWREISPGDLAERRQVMSRRLRPDFGLARLDDAAWHVVMPSFDGDPEGEVHARLSELLAELSEAQDDVRGAPFVVLDLRGNGGGSSHWSELVAQALWGPAWTAAHRPPASEGVDWRASADNIAEIAAFRDQLAANGGDSDFIAWAERAVAGMSAARTADLPYWREEVGLDVASADEPERPVNPINPVTGRVYVLTDAACASACLDAVDLWKALGAVQVGRETSADTLYMELRQVDLPSGLARAWVPMKVYRGRARGNNEPHRPAHVFDGDLSDDAALLAWIRALD